MAHGDITHIDIPVGDFGKAKAFYGDLFGWSIEEYPGYEDYPMWRAPNQISGGGLTQREAADEQPRSYVEVDSIDDVITKVRQRGGDVVTEKSAIDNTSWWATIKDPDGNLIGLYEGSTDSDES
jgi:uncharacterized protein